MAMAFSLRRGPWQKETLLGAVVKVKAGQQEGALVASGAR